MALTPEKLAILNSYYGGAKTPAAAPASKGNMFTNFLDDASRSATRRGLGVIDTVADFAPETVANVFGTTPEKFQGAMDRAIDKNRTTDRGFFESLPGNVLGDPMSVIGGGAKTALGMAMQGLGIGGLSGFLDPTKSNESRGFNTIVQGGLSAILSPVAGKTMEGLTSLGSKAVDKVLPDQVPISTAGDGVVEAARRSSIPVQDTTINVSAIDPQAMQGAIAQAGQDVKAGFVPRSIAKLPPDQAARAAMFLRNKVPYSAGDVTQDVTQQGLEDLALKGGYGLDAQAVAKTFRDSQQEGLQNAAQGTLKSIGKGIQLADNEADIATAIQEGLRSTRATARIGVKQAYDKVQQSGDAFVPTSAFTPLKDTIKTIKTQYPLDTMPGANSVINRMSGFLEKFDGNDKAVMNYRHVDNFRKFINNALEGSANRAERKVLGQLKNEMSTVVDDAVEQGLVIGNDKTISAIKSATGVARDYFKRFESNKIVNRIVEDDMTPESVISLVMGYGKLGGKKEAAATVGKIKDLLGDASPEFQQLKQAGVLRLLGTDMKSLAKDGLSGIKPAANVDDLVKTNQSLWKTLYTPEEQAQVTELARLIKEATVKQPGAVNFSGTSPALLRFTNSVLSKFGMGGNYAAGLLNKATGLAEKTSLMSNLENSFAGRVQGTAAAIPSFAQEFARTLGARLGQATGSAAGESLNTSPTPQAEPVTPTLTPEKRRIIEQYYQQQQSQPAPVDNQAPMPVQAQPVAPQSSIMPEIQKASQVSGINADLLMRIAKRENAALDPTLKNPDSESTATGLFQITNKTWRSLVKKHGKQYGIGYSDRKKPEANAIMAGMLAKENAASLKKRLGQEPTPGEIYMAHFLGDYAAAKLIKNKDSRNAAAALFPDAAKVNRNVFYAEGRPITAAQLYKNLSI